MAKVLQEQLSGIKVYKVGGEAEREVYIAGKTKDSRWAGLKTSPAAHASKRSRLRPPPARGGQHLAVRGELHHKVGAALAPLPLPPERRVVGGHPDAVRRRAAQKGLDLRQGHPRPDAAHVIFGQPGLPEQPVG
jgi:hypothetical protein